jgi:4-hydroxy-4-methyl-2-oxoglutarate aldolase
VYGHIYYNIARPDPDLLKAFSDVLTATLSDAMGRHGAISSEIRPIYENIRTVGSALTVLCFPGDNVMTHKALQMIQPGDVLVVDDGDYNTGCFGHKSALHARSRGGVGIVASGSVRDVACCVAIDSPRSLAACHRVRRKKILPDRSTCRFISEAL